MRWGFKFKVAFDYGRLIAAMVLACIGLIAYPHWSSPLCFGLAIGLNLWVLHKHVFVRIGGFEWGNKEFDV